MDAQRSRSLTGGIEPWVALALCATVLLVGGLGQLGRERAPAEIIPVPDWLSLAAVVFVAAALVRPVARPELLRVQQALRWGGLLLMIWAAQGLPLDLLRLTPLIPLPVDWPGLLRRTAAATAALLLAHLALARPAMATTRPARWYGYAAFLLALPYPLLRTSWALGGKIGLSYAGAAGRGWLPWLACIPWLMAAALSLLLVPTWRWLPRRLLLAGGWFATGMVALVGPGACWVLLSKALAGDDLRLGGIAPWIPAVFYGSWLLWASAAGAATRSDQLRTGRAAAVPESDTGERFLSE